MPATSAVARRAFGDARTRTISFAVLFAFMAYVQPVAYRHTYPTVADRLGFAATFGNNAAVRLFYGVPHDLLSVGGYTAWRTLAMVSIFASLWGVLGAVRAMRAEEESGRQELVLSGSVTRRAAYLAALAAVAAGALVLGAGMLLGLLGGGLPVGSSAYLVLAALSPLPVFVGVGALASQLAPTRRLALEIGSGVLVIALLVRVVADTASSLDWLRWVTPLGWAEELRPFTASQPAVLVLPLALSVILLVAAALIADRRDIGDGLLPANDRSEPRLRLLGSPAALALRMERGSLVGWLVGVAGFALVVGLLTHAFSKASVPIRFQQQISKLGGASVMNPAGALGLYFLFFVLVISLFLCSQVAAMRRNESDQELETLFALPISRRRWLWSRIGVAFCAAALLALVAAVFSWGGAAVSGGGVSLLQMLKAGANCLPASLLFFGLGVLTFAVLPRAAMGVAYGLVAVAFLWELLGSILGVPVWTLGLSPFHQIGLVPAQPFKATAALVMVLIGVVALGLATRLFEARDLTGA